MFWECSVPIVWFRCFLQAGGMCCAAVRSSWFMMFSKNSFGLQSTRTRGRPAALKCEARPSSLGLEVGISVKGQNAKDVQSDLTGRWVSYNISSSDDYCILEPDRRLPEHIRKLDVFGKVPGYNKIQHQLVCAFFLECFCSLICFCGFLLPEWNYCILCFLLFCTGGDLGVCNQWSRECGRSQCETFHA